tara:strand:- start:262 stop:630 length:369 start_codon:yes stop_codon:yes gene_type:complete
MMLRVSAMTTETEVDLQGVNGDAASAALGIEYGTELMSFAESLAQRDESGLARSRTALRQAAGDKVLVDAAGVAANFQRMVRIADSIGIPFDNMQSDFANSIQTELNLARFASAQHSLADIR